MSEKKYVQSVERAMDIIEFIGNHRVTKLNEICEALELKAPTAHGLLQTLEHRGYITRVGKTQYSLGVNCLKLGLQYDFGSHEYKKIHSLLEDLVKEIDETCYFELKIGEYNYFYDTVESTQQLKVVYDSEKHTRFPENSAVNRMYNSEDKALKYVADLEQVEMGLNCMAIPYRTDGEITACIAFTGPSCRFTEEKMTKAYEKFVEIMKKNQLEDHI